MSSGWLVALIVAVSAAATVVWRRTRVPTERRREVAERRDHAMKRIEAYAFLPLGTMIAVVALFSWQAWLSVAGLALAGLFLFTGLTSLRDLRRRGVG